MDNNVIQVKIGNDILVGLKSLPPRENAILNWSIKAYKETQNAELGVQTVRQLLSSMLHSIKGPFGEIDFTTPEGPACVEVILRAPTTQHIAKIIAVAYQISQGCRADFIDENGHLIQDVQVIFPPLSLLN